MELKRIWGLLSKTYSRWKADNATMLAAGLSYFTVFSLAPLMILSVAVAGLVFGQAAAEGVIVRQLGGILGEQVAGAVQNLVSGARNSGLGAATALGMALLLFGASQIFLHLQTALNMIWGLAPMPAGRGLRFRRLLRKRVISFAMVLGIGVLLVAFFLADAVLGVLWRIIGDILPVRGSVAL